MIVQVKDEENVKKLKKMCSDQKQLTRNVHNDYPIVENVMKKMGEKENVNKKSLLFISGL